MPERSSKEPAIKLFGKKIPLLFGGDSPAISGEGSPSSDKEKVLKREEQPEKDCSSGEVTETTQEDEAPPPSSGVEESVDPETLPESNVNPKTPSISEESAKTRNSKAEKEQSDASKSQEKPLKKPDKILPCPRCNSMETKFCYYNNYNINQPRHFCKACQRYWTAGGTMRNVPVGAGRRKNKNSSSHFRHITISEALQAARIDAPIGTHHHPALKTNGTVLSFGLEAPICDSMASILNLADKKVLNSTQNGFHRFEGKQNPSPCKVGEIGDDCSSSVTVSSSVEEAGTNYPREPFVRSINGFVPPIPCLPGVPWPYPWNSAVAPPPALCPPGFPMPFYPAAYWNCGMAGAWNIPMLSPQCSSSSNQKEQCPSPNSPLLGKHSRDNRDLKPDELGKGVSLKHKNGCVLVPKILRIDDPNEAAKSSIWTTLGIKNESIGREGLFKAFQPKCDEKNCPAVNYPALRANPAALSRSIDFHEST